MGVSEFDSEMYHALRTKYFKKTKDQDQRVQKFIDAQGAGAIREHPGNLDKGGERPPDVTTQVGAQSGVQFVLGFEDEDGSGKKVLGNAEGVSVTTTFGTMGGMGWCYIVLPNGTKIPPTLDLVHDPVEKDDGHHLVRVRNRMRMDAFHGALDNLARNAIVAAKKQGVSVIRFV